MTSENMSAEILEKRTIHDGWAKYSVLRVRLPDGQTAKRELEEHGPAVAVLPYDAERRTALLVCQFRAPVLAAAGEATLMEAVAGFTDGEAPDEAARREALEEAGVQLKGLEPVGTVWTMPGLSTERMHLYLAPYARGDRVEEGGGAHGEHENITVLELPLRELAAMADGGALADMKTFALIQTLRLKRPELFMAGQSHR
jgi:nudix-type nucleoside diphosphatase (YffH/AdpP family)